MTNNSENSFSLSESLRLSFYKAMAKLLGMLPFSAIDSLARVLGGFIWYFIPSRRKKTIASIQKHLAYNKERAQEIARASFTENMRSFLEIFHVAQYDETQNGSQILPQEIYDQFKKERAPVVVTSAHIGSWELLAGMVEGIHPERSRMVVVRKQKDRAMALLLEELRSSRGITPIGHRQAAQKVMECLRGKGTVAFLVDHNTSRKEALFLPFLNEAAAVNSGPAMLALRAKAVIYPLFNIREGKANYCYLYPPLRTAELKGTVSERVEIIARYYTECVEDIVKKYPEQWFWMHNRWKTKPQ